MRVLIVDDSRTMRSLIKRYLADLALEVVEAGDGRQGFEALAAGGSFDLVVADMHMPEMNGRELVDLEEVQRALAAGANEYVMKPFEKDALLDKLRVLGLLGD